MIFTYRVEKTSHTLDHIRFKSKHPSPRFNGESMTSSLSLIQLTDTFFQISVLNIYSYKHIHKHIHIHIHIYVHTYIFRVSYVIRHHISDKGIVILYRLLTITRSAHTWNNKIKIWAKIVTITWSCKSVINNGCSYITANFEHFNGKWEYIKMMKWKGFLFLKKFFK